MERVHVVAGTGVTVGRTRWTFRPGLGGRRTRSILRSVLPIAVTAVAVTALGFAQASETYRFLITAIVLLTSLVQVARLRGRDRLMANEAVATARVAEAEERLRTLLEGLPASVYLDTYRRSDGAYLDNVYISPQMEQLTGYRVEAMRADPELWLSVIHPDDRERVMAVDIKGHLSGNAIEQEYRIIQASGEVIWIREEARVLASKNPELLLSHGFMVDITERKMLEQQLGRLAFHDALTGLANRASFSDRLVQAFSRSVRSGSYPAVLFLDLDDFKSVNDSLGHSGGDRLLQVVAERLRAAVRPADCVARLGGDEFAILLEDIEGADVAIAAANRLLRLLRRPIEIEGRQLIGRGSIGIAVAAATTESPQDLLRDADAAMYRAKAAGRGNWVMFDPDMHTQELARFDLEADLRAAVESDELGVVYQPICSLETGRPSGAAASVRWDHPARGPISPLVFMGIAEDSELIVEIGRKVLRQACMQAAAWRADGVVDQDFAITVKVSIMQLTLDLPAMVAAVLTETGLPWRNLVIAVTESAVMRDSHMAIEILAALRRRGARIAIDDFGTGFTSLGDLQTLPIDVIRIDRTYVAEIGKPFELAIVRALIQIAATLSLQTIADGVETGAQARALGALGCLEGQGALFGPPRAPEAMALLAHQSAVAMA